MSTEDENIIWEGDRVSYLTAAKTQAYGRVVGFARTKVLVKVGYNSAGGVIKAFDPKDLEVKND